MVSPHFFHDKDGNLTSITYPAIGSVPAVTITYAYDSRDRLTSVTDWSGRVTNYTWDAAGKLTSVSRPNGTTRRLRWDTAGELLAIEKRPPTGAPLAIRSFGYDAAGRITRRLSYPQGTAWSEPALSASVNDDNQLTGGVLGYDADGNTLASLLPNGPWGASGTSTNANGTFAWNARNQLTSVTRSDNNGQTATYTYDAEGNFIQTTDSAAGTTRWIVDPDGGSLSRVIAKVAPNGNVTRYVYGVGLVYEVRQDGSVRYYHYDQVGSTVALTDAAGAVTGRADYSPYGALQSGSGELANANTTPFLFCGAFGVITDSTTGMHEMRARWYSSYLRRFLTEDPTGFAGGENYYVYADGSPLILIDPAGLDAYLGVNDAHAWAAVDTPRGNVARFDYSLTGFGGYTDNSIKDIYNNWSGPSHIDITVKHTIGEVAGKSNTVFRIPQTPQQDAQTFERMVTIYNDKPNYCLATSTCVKQTLNVLFSASSEPLFSAGSEQTFDLRSSYTPAGLREAAGRTLGEPIIQPHTSIKYK